MDTRSIVAKKIAELNEKKKTHTRHHSGEAPITYWVPIGATEVEHDEIHGRAILAYCNTLWPSPDKIL